MRKPSRLDPQRGPGAMFLFPSVRPRNRLAIIRAIGRRHRRPAKRAAVHVQVTGVVRRNRPRCWLLLALLAGSLRISNGGIASGMCSAYRLSVVPSSLQWVRWFGFSRPQAGHRTVRLTVARSKSSRNLDALGYRRVASSCRLIPMMSPSH